MQSGRHKSLRAVSCGLRIYGKVLVLTALKYKVGCQYITSRELGLAPARDRLSFKIGIVLSLSLG